MGAVKQAAGHARTGLDGKGTRAPRLTKVEIQKDAKGHTRSYSHSVGGRRPSIFNESFSEYDEEAPGGGDHQGGWGTGEGGEGGADGREGGKSQRTR